MTTLVTPYMERSVGRFCNWFNTDPTREISKFRSFANVQFDNEEIIPLSDTFLMDTDRSEFDYSNKKGRYEIVGIVAHELGHWSNMDSFKLLAFSLIRIYLIFFAFSYSMKYTDMPNDFGFKGESVFLSLLLFTTLLEPFMEMIEI